MKSTRILIDDGLSMRSVGGIGEYSRSLEKALGDNPKSKETGQLFDVTKTRPIVQNLPSRKIARFAYLANLQLLSPFRYAVSNIDIVHFTHFYAPMWKLPSIGYVVTIHDLTGWENPSLVPIPTNIFKFMKKMTEAGIARADAVVVPASKSRDNLIELLDLDPAKVFVCPNIVKPIFERERVSDRASNLLIVIGTISHRKNTVAAVKAFARIAGNFPDLKLVIAGAKGDAYDETVQLIASLGLSNRVEIKHDLSDQELVELYKKAALLISPSHYEGFGIPIIEAMAIGLPVIASSIEVFKEVGGDAIDYFEEPADIASLAQQIETVLGNSNKRLQMSEAGITEAAKYSASNVVGRYHHIYDSISRS